MRARITAAALAAGLLVPSGAWGVEKPPSATAVKVLKILVQGTDNGAGSLAHTIVNRDRRGELPAKADILRGLKIACEHKSVKPRRRRVTIRIMADIGGPEMAVFFQEHLGERSWDGETFAFMVKKSGDLLGRHRPPAEGEEDDAVGEAMGELVEALIVFAKAERGPLKDDALKAVGASGRMDAAPELVKMLRDEPELRRGAHAALQDLTGRKLPCAPGAWAAYVAEKVPDSADDLDGVPPPLEGGFMAGGGSVSSGEGVRITPAVVMEQKPGAAENKPCKRYYVFEIIIVVALVVVVTVSSGLVGKRQSGAAKGKGQAAKRRRHR